MLNLLVLIFYRLVVLKWGTEFVGQGFLYFFKMFHL